MAKSIKNLKFEEALERLDAIVSAMESGEIPLEESLAKYEEATRLAARCREILNEAEQRIQKIQLGAEGQPEAVPFEPTPQQDDEPENEA